MRASMAICWLMIVAGAVFAAETLEQKIMPLKDGTLIRASYKNNMVVLIEHLTADGSLINGDKEFETGNIKIIDAYEHGLLKRRKSYFANGRVWYDIQMTKEGTQPEMVVEYTQDGELKNGEYKENFNNGRLKSTGFYKSGIPDGKFQSFCANGKLAVEREFENGVLVGVDKYYEEGELYCKDDPFLYFDVGFYSLPKR